MGEIKTIIILLIQYLGVRSRIRCKKCGKHAKPYYTFGDGTGEIYIKCKKCGEIEKISYEW